MSKHNYRNHKEHKPVYIGVVNDSVITTESVKLALKRMEEVDIGIKVELIEEIPFLRNLIVYLSKYKLDIVIIDSEMEKQNVLLYIERIKNFDPDIKIIVLAKFITSKIVEYNEKGYIDEYITLPFQDANLWNAIEKIVFPNRKKRKDETMHTVMTKNIEIDENVNINNSDDDDLFLFDDMENDIEEDECFDIPTKNKPKENIDVFEYARRLRKN